MLGSVSLPFLTQNLPGPSNPEAQAQATSTVTADEKSLTVNDLEVWVQQRAAELEVNPSLAGRIAFCESGLRQFNDRGEIVRGRRNRFDVGLFQINELYHLEKSRELNLDIYATEGNIEYALWLLKNEGERHWRWSKACWSQKLYSTT